MEETQKLETLLKEVKKCINSTLAGDFKLQNWSRAYQNLTNFYWSLEMNKQVDVAGFDHLMYRYTKVDRNLEQVFNLAEQNNKHIYINEVQPSKFLETMVVFGQKLNTKIIYFLNLMYVCFATGRFFPIVIIPEKQYHDNEFGRAVYHLAYPKEQEEIKNNLESMIVEMGYKFAVRGITIKPFKEENVEDYETWAQDRKDNPEHYNDDDVILEETIGETSSITIHKLPVKEKEVLNVESVEDMIEQMEDAAGALAGSIEYLKKLRSNKEAQFKMFCESIDRQICRMISTEQDLRHHISNDKRKLQEKEDDDVVIIVKKPKRVDDDIIELD